MHAIAHVCVNLLQVLVADTQHADSLFFVPSLSFVQFFRIKRVTMNFSISSFVRSAAMLVAIVGSTVSANAALVNLGVYNTGVTNTKFDAATQTLIAVPTAATPGVDSHYTLVAPGTKTGSTYAAANTIGHDAPATSGGALNWITQSTKSEYITWKSNGVGGSAVSTSSVGTPTTFIYQTTFSTTDSTTVHFAGGVAASQNGGSVVIAIDGVNVGTAGPMTSANNGSFKNYNFSAIVGSGAHTLSFTVTQTSNTAKNGFNNVFTTATAVVPEPSTFALLGMGVVGMAVAGYRRRRNAV